MRGFHDKGIMDVRTVLFFCLTLGCLMLINLKGTRKTGNCFFLLWSVARIKGIVCFCSRQKLKLQKCSSLCKCCSSFIYSFLVFRNYEVYIVDHAPERIYQCIAMAGFKITLLKYVVLFCRNLGPSLSKMIYQLYCSPVLS